MLRFLLLFFLVLPTIAFAQGDFAPLTNLPGIAEVAGQPDLGPFLNNLYRLLIGAAAVIAVIQIMRAGIMFMTNKGSVSENEQARHLIQMSVVGLVLILSPVIVFSIINPEILNLQVNTSSLKTNIGDVSIDDTTGDGSCNLDCAVGTVCQSGECVSAEPDSCPVIADEQVITTQAEAACCNAQENCVASVRIDPDNLGNSPQVCSCRDPRENRWGWRGRVVPASGSGGETTAERGGFASQAACQASITEYAQANNVNFTGEFQCTCNSPLSEQPTCSTL